MPPRFATSSTTLPGPSIPNTPSSSGSSAKLNQPVLDTYNQMQFGTETFTRDFNPKWYKVYPWLDFSIPTRKAVFFLCERFLDISDFAYSDWKHVEKGLLIRQQKNPSH